MLNMEGISPEAKIGKILVLVAIILGILVIFFFSLIGAVIYTAGTVAALSVSLTIPLLFVVSILIVKIIGLIIGFFALISTEKKDFNRAGILAIVSSILPPVDLVMLIGGIFCLISREANENGQGSRKENES